MKQSPSTPLFRNCPNADIFKRELRSDCRRCDLYEECIRKKSRRRAMYRRKKAKCQKRKFMFVIFFLFAVILIIKVHNNSFAMEKDENFVINDVQIEVEQETIKETEKIESENYTSERTVDVIEEVEEPIVEIFEETVEEKVQEPKISAYEPGEAYYYEISNDDKIYIAKLLYKEARGEIYEGMVAVANTVLNRYFSDDPRFDRTSIYSVITQDGAYASINDVTINMVNEIPELMQAVEDACHGWDPTRRMFTEGAKFFYAPKEVKGYQKQIREGIQVLQIGNHNFHNDLND